MGIIERPGGPAQFCARRRAVRKNVWWPGELQTDDYRPGALGGSALGYVRAVWAC